MFGVVKYRMLDSQLTPLGAILNLLVIDCHNEVFHVEARAIDPAVEHHRTPSLQRKTVNSVRFVAARLHEWKLRGEEKWLEQSIMT